jgi:hypothetical protein
MIADQLHADGTNERIKVQLQSMQVEIIDPQGFRVAITAQHETSRGVAWRARIYHGTQQIGWAENAGQGGPTQTRISDHTMFALYRAAARTALPQSGEPQARFAEILATYDEVGYVHVKP